ncbi:MAG TPA: hypothetical protein DD640_07995 [Clostridiales bacterium]|nr:hypothetical protein [Clostridiales bacterium]
MIVKHAELAPNRRWQLVVSDLDGTLLDAKNRISPENKAAVADLAAQGIAFTLATGRTDWMARTYISQLKVRLPVISFNGAMIRDCGSNRVLYQRSIYGGEVRQLTAWLEENKLDYLWYSPDAIYYPGHSERIRYIRAYNRMAAEYGSGGVPVLPVPGPDSPNIASGLVKVLAILPDPDVNRRMRDYLAAHPALNGQMSSDVAMDITAAGTSKGLGLSILADLLGYRLDQVVAFGDNDNDISMLEAAGLGIAMGNASPQALAASSFQTTDHERSGFAAGIRRFVLPENPAAN